MEIVMTHKPTIQWCADNIWWQSIQKNLEVNTRCSTDGGDVLEML